VLEGTSVAAPHLEDAATQPGEQPPTKLASDGIGPSLLAPLEAACEARLL
jgi:hypothetical protein